MFQFSEKVVGEDNQGTSLHVYSERTNAASCIVQCTRAQKIENAYDGETSFMCLSICHGSNLCRNAHILL